MIETVRGFMDWVSNIAGTVWGAKPDILNRQPVDEMVAEAERITEALEEEVHFDSGQFQFNAEAREDEDA